MSPRARSHLVAALLATTRLLARRRLPPPPPEPPELPPFPPGEDPREYEVPANPRAETLVAVLLLLVGAAGGGFVWSYVSSAGTLHTQLLGITLGLTFLLLAAALIVLGKSVVPQVIEVEEREDLSHPEVEQEIAETVESAGLGLTRKRLLTGGAGVAALGVGAAAIVPAGSFGPWVGNTSIPSPWYRGRRLVDETGKPLPTDALDVGSFMTAFAEGRPHDDLAAVLIVVRLAPQEIHLPPERRDWAPEGFQAFSKICTHAACAVAMMRYPLFRADAARPALVCPCHYSTFDVTDAAKVLFGPAGRPLPQLPLQIGHDGNLAAAGPLSGDVGPAWLNVNRGPQISS
jgi:ubiquinol-cytochrome c reductase iron-sulfur subunit